MFKPKVNLGVNDLWAIAYRDFKPYQDRLRSTNATEFVRDTNLDKATESFNNDNSVAVTEFTRDNTIGS
jgi:hypothetical protein